jgi:uncharacterized membrane protein
MKNNLLKYGALAAGFLALAVPAFAQTPAYQMNSGVQTAATDLLTSLTSQIFTIIPVAIGIVGGVVVTLFGLRWLIGFVRSNMHG